MEMLVMVLMILVCFHFMLKQTFRPFISVWAMAVVCALFVGLMWPYAIEQSKTQIADWLANPTRMLDTAVLLSVEVVLQLTFCMLAVEDTIKKKRVLWTYKFLRWFPGVLIFPVLFSGLVALIFALPGVSFALIAWCLAAGVLVLIPLGSLLLRRLLPEEELRLELLFLTNAFIALLGIIATVNGRTSVKGVSEVHGDALAVVAGLAVAGALLGMGLRNIKQKHTKFT